MSTSISTLALPAENSGWELWTLGKKNSLQHHSSIKGEDKLSSKNLPNGTCLALPTSHLATLPLLISSTDSSLTKGAARLALEKASFLDEATAQHAWDALTIEQKDNQTLLTAIALGEDQLDPKHRLHQCASFDLSARLFQPTTNQDTVACWQEHGQWILTCYRNRKPLYTEPLGNLTPELPQTIDLLRSQFLLKGILFNPENIHLWSPTSLLPEFHKIQDAFTGSPYHLTPGDRPAPSLPEPLLELQPAAVHLHHQKKAQRARNARFLGLLLLLYLIGLGYLWWSHQQVKEEIAQTQEEIDQHTPLHLANQDHFDQWNQLQAITTENWPMELYKECVLLLPPGKKIRFTQIELQELAIVIQGNSIDLNAAKKLDLNLKNSEFFQNYTWKTPSALRNPKTKLYNFSYEATLNN